MEEARLYTLIEARHPDSCRSYFWIAGRRLADKNLRLGNRVWVRTALGMRTVTVLRIFQVYGPIDFARKYQLKPAGRFAGK